jgi:hypothetical protein
LRRCFVGAVDGERSGFESSAQLKHVRMADFSSFRSFSVKLDFSERVSKSRTMVASAGGVYVSSAHLELSETIGSAAF